MFVGVVFQSTLTKNLQNLKYHETVIYDKVTLNEGNAYNKDTGKLTATVEGVYALSWTTLSSPGKYFLTEIVHNGNAIWMALSQCDGRGQSGWPSSSNQVNIKMKKGDKVWIRTYGKDGLYAFGNWCSFSGFKIWWCNESNDTYISGNNAFLTLHRLTFGNFYKIKYRKSHKHFRSFFSVLLRDYKTLNIYET